MGVELNPGPRTRRRPNNKKPVSKKALQKQNANPKRNSLSSMTNPLGAPSAIGTVVQARRMTTKSGSNGSLVLSGRHQICQIATDSAGTFLPVFTLGAAAAADATHFSIAVDPVGNGGISNSVLFSVAGSPLAQIGASFARYRFRKLILHYVPASPTSYGGRITIAYVPEAASSFSTVTNMTASLLGQTNDYMSFPVWEPASLVCTGVREFKEPLYSVSIATSGSTTAALTRQQAQGTLLLSSATPLAAAFGTSALVGELHAEYEIEFMEPGPYSLTTIESRRRLPADPVSLTNVEKPVPLVVHPTVNIDHGYVSVCRAV